MSTAPDLLAQAERRTFLRDCSAGVTTSVAVLAAATPAQISAVVALSRSWPDDSIALAVEPWASSSSPQPLAGILQPSGFGFLVLPDGSVHS